MMTTTPEIRDVEYARLLTEVLPRPIQSESEHARLTQQLLALDERGDLSPEEQALAEVLILLIEDYEEKHHPMPEVSAADSLKALMEERGLKHKDVWPVLGNKGCGDGDSLRPAFHQQGSGEEVNGAFPRTGRNLPMRRATSCSR